MVVESANRSFFDATLGPGDTYEYETEQRGSGGGELSYQSDSEVNKPRRPMSQDGRTAVSTAAATLRIRQEKPGDGTTTNGKENLMRQLKAELDEEIKERRLVEHKHSVINGSGGGVKMRDKAAAPADRRTIRSKSVTFLDEMNTDDDDELIECVQVHHQEQQNSEISGVQQ